MAKPMGRTDDMLIIRGVNVFPSQIETVLLNEGYEPHYQIVVDRVNNTDTFEVNVEMTAEKFTDKAVCVKDGRTTACYRIDVTDEYGNLAATVTATGYHIGA